MANSVVWCDIPVLDLNRAVRFYSAVLGTDVQKQEFQGMAFGLLPHVENGVAGCLYTSPTDKPSDHGPLVYLNVEGRHEKAEAAVAGNGGKVVKSKHQIGPHGFRSIILDSEGNRMALHSR